MTNAICTYFFLGLSLAASIGPVNVAQLDKGIKQGFFHAWFFGLGALTADILSMVLVYCGVMHFIEAPFMQILLWSFGCFVLIYTGTENLLTLYKIEMDFRFGKNEPFSRTVFSGFFTALLNPLTILFWLGIYGSILAETAEGFLGGRMIVSSLAVISGIILWDLIMAFLSSRAREILSVTLLKMISVVSSFYMIGFGGYFGLQAYQAFFGLFV